MTIAAENPTKRPFTILHNDCLESDIFDNVYQREVYITLKKFCNSDNQCFPSLNKIASITKMCKRTVQKALKALKDKFLINIQHRFKSDGSKTSNLYTVYDSPALWTTDNKTEIGKITVEEPEEIMPEEVISEEITPEEVISEEITPEEVISEEIVPVVAEAQIESNKKVPVPNSNQTIDTSSNKSRSNDTMKLKKSQVKTNLENLHEEMYPLEFLKRHYNFASMVEDYPLCRLEINAVMDIIYDTVNTSKSTIRIGGEDKIATIVISKYLKLHDEEIIYVIRNYKMQSERIKNPKAYIQTMLYNAKEQYRLDMENLETYDVMHNGNNSI